MSRRVIVLSAESREKLEDFSKKGVRNVRLVNRAKIILAFDTSEGRKACTQYEIAQRLGVSRQTIINTKEDFLKAESVSVFLRRKKRVTPPVPPKITGELEARIIALACGKTPQGKARWTLQLLADKSVELHYIDKLSHMTVSRLLKKHNLNLI